MSLRKVWKWATNELRSGLHTGSAAGANGRINCAAPGQLPSFRSSCCRQAASKAGPAATLC